MTRLQWNTTREYEIGLDRGIFYPQIGPGVTWNGLTSVEENINGGDTFFRYVDGVKMYSRRFLEEFSGTIQAYTYPEEMYQPLLDEWTTTPFGLTYRTMTADGSQIHLVYNVTISPGGISHQQSETDLFEWDFSTLPIDIPEARKTAHLIVNTKDAYSWTTSALEDLLYGSDTNAPQLPSPEQVLEVFEENSILKVFDNGDGTYTVEGPDEAILDLGSGIHRISWPSVIFVGGYTYQVSSL